jgi:aminomethyltransferase
MEKKTPLYSWHETHGGKIVPFGGFLLPVQFETGLITEHCTVREKAGLFDVSHMGEFVISGKAALDAVQRIFTNDFSNLAIGRVRYTTMCNDEGGILDDMVINRMDEERFLLVPNASNREKDAAWIKSHIGDAVFEDLSDSYGQIALQGPASLSILASISETIPQKYYSLIEKGKAAGIDCIISQTGYTGETGFELYCKSSDTEALWQKLLEAGKAAGVIPCGLGARDTLRLEASMPLYGHEMNETITPFEAGLSFAIKMGKDDFIGKKALLGRETPARIRTGLKVTGKGIIREQCPVFHEGKNIGITTSGTFLPWLKQSMAMALLGADYSSPGIKVEADVRGKMIEAETCAMPFYKRS